MAASANRLRNRPSTESRIRRNSLCETEGETGFFGLTMGEYPSEYANP